MNIPDGYRRLELGEATLPTDEYQSKFMDRPRVMHDQYSAGIVGQYPYDDHGNFTLWQILRKISSPWIAMSERKPKIGEVVLFSENPSKIQGLAGYAWVGELLSNGAASNQNYRGLNYWMPIPEAPKPIPPPIYIDESGTKREVIFRENGEVIVGCVTVPASTMNSIIKCREEVMKG